MLVVFVLLLPPFDINLKKQAIVKQESSGNHVKFVITKGHSKTLTYSNKYNILMGIKKRASLLALPVLRVRRLLL